jgi:hypothetical protein
MPSYHLRFVGQTSLPKSLSQSDVDEAFCLSTQDIAELRKFEGPRLGAAVQLVFLRASGRSLNAVASIPRVLLQSLCKALGLTATSIASLNRLYKRRETRFEHQRWAREHCGFSPAGVVALTELRSVQATLAGSAASIDDLVKQAELWLYDNSYLIPGDRVLRDIAREVFAAQESRALETVRRQISQRRLRAAIARVFSRRLGRTGGTVLEWLRTPPAKHGLATLSATTKKVMLLKALGVHEWDLSAIPSARLQAYSQAVANRPPFDTQRLSDDTKDLEIACFLYATLLELTDVTADIAGRRVCDFNVMRQAACRPSRPAVQSTYAKSASRFVPCCTTRIGPRSRRSPRSRS